MFALSYALSGFHLRKVSTITSKQLSAKRCSNIIVLLCTDESEKIESLMRTLARTNSKSSLSRGSSPPVACTTKFFVTTVNDWESLIVDTKICTLVALGVLALLLCEIKISKLNRQDISETGYC